MRRLCAVKVRTSHLLLLGVASGFAPLRNRRRHHDVSLALGETLESLAAKVERALSLIDDTSDTGSTRSSVGNPAPTNHQREQRRRVEVLNSRLPGVALNRTYVGPSSVAGRGLFAGTDCPVGTVLTCYPGDGIVDRDDEEVLWGEHVDLANDLTTAEDGWDDDYVMYLSEEMSLVGLAPLDGDPAYLGHFANDGASRAPRTLKEVVTTYLEESEARANAKEQEVLDSHMALVATRDIAKDEEIFLCYGPEYWMHQPGFDAGFLD